MRPRSAARMRSLTVCARSHSLEEQAFYTSNRGFAIGVNVISFSAKSSALATLSNKHGTRMTKRDNKKGLDGVLGRRTFSLRRSDAGSVSLEFVILLPFLIMLLVGIVDGSFILYDKAVITNAARAGARAGTVLKVPPPSASEIAAITTASAQGSLVTNGNASAPTVSVWPLAPPPGGPLSGSPLKVTVSYSYHGLLLGSALSALTGPIVLNATAVMNYE